MDFTINSIPHRICLKLKKANWDRHRKRRLTSNCQKGENLLRTIILKAASRHIPSGRHRISTEPVPAEILERMRARDPNCIKERKAYITYRNHTSRQRQFKTGLPQGGILSPTLFNIYTSDLPPPSAPVQVMAYADDITITSTHKNTSAVKKYIQPYLQKVFAWTKQNIWSNLFHMIPRLY